MELTITIVTLILAFIIVFYEWRRGKSGIKGKVDFMKMVSLVYFICFVLFPLYMKFANLNAYRDLGSWVFSYDFNDAIFLYASIFALIGYILIIAGYKLASLVAYKYEVKQVKQISQIHPPSNKYLFIVATLLGTIGLVSFYIYMRNLGGLWILIKYSGALRSHEIIVTSTAFLRNIAPLTLASSYFYYALLYKVSRPILKTLIAVLFVIMFLSSILILFHQAGRLNLVAYLSLFLLVKMIKDNKIKPTLLILVIALVSVTLLYGKPLFNSFLDTGAIDRAATQIDSTGPVGNIMLEFAFPYITLANVVNFVPTQIDYRWFIDIFIGIANLVPKRIFPVDLPDTISDVNTSMLNSTLGGQIPVDLVSFGYYSAGLFGIVLVTILFGICLNAFDKLFPINNEPVFMIFRGAWILFLAFRVMYGDPTIIIKIGFYLFVGSFFLLVPSLFSQRRLIVMQKRTDQLPII